MKRYDEYKQTGTPWIGEIPSHWEVMRLKFPCSLSGRIGWNGLKADEFKEESYAYLVTGQDFRGPNVEWDKCYQIEQWRYDEDPFIQLKNGHLLITKDGTIGKIAKVSNLDKPACLNSGIFVLKQKHNDFNQGFLYWHLVSALLKDFNEFNSGGQTTIQHLYQNVFENMPLVVPPIAEQEAIAAYLDKKCGSIDAVIATQERRIALLEELKQSVITEAVTHGINPDAKLRPSGINWIGNIPDHWEVMPLKYAANKKGCCFIDGDWIESKDIVEEGIKYITTGNIGALTYKEQGSGYISEKTFATLGCTEVFEGDILISRLNEPIGRCCIIPNLGNRVVTSVDNVIFRPDTDKYNKKFIVYYLNSNKFTEHANLIARGATMHRISRTMLGHQHILVPPLTEQQEIVEYIESKIKPIDASIAKAKREIELLKELKQSVITEAVTGKIKVC